jgi:hypothetical protein
MPAFGRKAEQTPIPARTQNAVRRYRTMDVSKRQLLQKALEKATEHGSLIAVSTPAGKRILLRPHFICYETYVEGTDGDGQLLTLTYDQNASVDAE